MRIEPEALHPSTSALLYALPPPRVQPADDPSNPGLNSRLSPFFWRHGAQAFPPAWHPNGQVTDDVAQAPLPLQADVMNVPPVHAGTRHDVAASGYAQLVRLMPSHRPPQVPLPAHPVRGVVTATQVPRLVELAHDSHSPAQALLQQNPSRQNPLAHSALRLHPSPFLLATHVPFSQTGVLPLQPPQHCALGMHELLQGFCPGGQVAAHVSPPAPQPNGQVVVAKRPLPLQVVRALPTHSLSVRSPTQGPKLRAAGSHVCVPQSLQGRDWFPMQGQPSLALPLQFASSPAIAQLSNGSGGVSPLQGPQTCATQVWVPAWQLPVFVPHARTSPSTQAQPSFGIPSQLASSPPTSQRSRAWGPTAPSHAAQ